MATWFAADVAICLLAGDGQWHNQSCGAMGGQIITLSLWHNGYVGHVSTLRAQNQGLSWLMNVLPNETDSQMVVSHISSDIDISNLVFLPFSYCQGCLSKGQLHSTRPIGSLRAVSTFRAVFHWHVSWRDVKNGLCWIRSLFMCSKF